MLYVGSNSDINSSWCLMTKEEELSKGTLVIALDIIKQGIMVAWSSISYIQIPNTFFFLSCSCKFGLMNFLPSHSNTPRRNFPTRLCTLSTTMTTCKCNFWICKALLHVFVSASHHWPARGCGEKFSQEVEVKLSGCKKRWWLCYRETLFLGKNLAS